MSKVITFSRTFPGYHPRAGQPTYFVEKFYKSFRNGDGAPETFWPFIDKYLETFGELPGKDFDSKKDFFTSLAPKHHTIRAGHRWKAGDWFSPRVWSGKPYNSKQIQFAPDIQIKKVWNVQRDDYGIFLIEGKDTYDIRELAKNDGLSEDDLWRWIKWPMEGQIICWDETIEY